MLQNDSLRLPSFQLDAEPDPAFHFDADSDPYPAFPFDADPDPSSQNYADPGLRQTTKEKNKAPMVPVRYSPLEQQPNESNINY